MISAFSGDAFLATRAARRVLRARGFRVEEVTELGEGMQAAEVAQLAAQSGLFGNVALLLDFSAAFKGQGGVKPRNEVLKVLETVPDDTFVVVLDLETTSSRQKTYKALGDHYDYPTPRFSALTHWVRQELTENKVRFHKDVPDTLADLFGEDLPSLAAEVQKLAVLDEELSSERLKEIVNRPASRDAFDFIEATAAGDLKRALLVCQSLMAQGEAPPRILGALMWQYDLVARVVALQESRARVDVSLVTQTLKLKPFVAQKVLATSQHLSEATLLYVLRLILDADVAMKTGRNEVHALEELALKLASFYARAR